MQSYLFIKNVHSPVSLNTEGIKQVSVFLFTVPSLFQQHFTQKAVSLAFLKTTLSMLGLAVSLAVCYLFCVYLCVFLDASLTHTDIHNSTNQCPSPCVCYISLLAFGPHGSTSPQALSCVCSGWCSYCFSCLVSQRNSIAFYAFLE